MPDNAVSWPADVADDPPMTPREEEVARLVSQGLANKVVAKQLGIGEGTVKAHLHNIYQKLHVSNRTKLILSTITDRRI
jgi:two-component system, NarL family, nitrate/nitrite response regulator NarL